MSLVPDPRGNGILLVAALLTLGLLFAASWIVFYVTPGYDPSVLWPSFGAAVVVLLAGAFVASYRQGRGSER